MCMEWLIAGALWGLVDVEFKLRHLFVSLASESTNEGAPPVKKIKYEEILGIWTV